MAGFGQTVVAKMMAASPAALVVTQRKGNGKLRHVRIGQMWVQQLADQEEVSFKKIKGDINPADLGTKHLTRPNMDILIPMLSLYDAEGRAETSLRL